MLCLTWANVIQGPVLDDRCCCSFPSLPLAGSIYPRKRLIPQTACLCHSFDLTNSLYLIPKDECPGCSITLLSPYPLFENGVFVHHLSGRQANRVGCPRGCNDDLMLMIVDDNEDHYLTSSSSLKMRRSNPQCCCLTCSHLSQQALRPTSPSIMPSSTQLDARCTESPS